ncbi:MAG: hypothetical protein KDB27_28050 [Planctomycetales bacterium]|nr:hypothetical protein [Planctomycetales bacterium]
MKSAASHKRSIYLPLAVCAIVVLHAFCETALSEELRIGYSFARKGGGGMAMATVEADTGKILSQDIQYQSVYCTAPKKLRSVGDGKTFVMTNDDEMIRTIFVIDIEDSGRSRVVQMPGVPDEVRVAGTQLVITCSRDFLATVDINSRRILGMWDVSQLLKPPGNHPQDILVVPDGKHAIVSFQKDSPGGKKLGGRLVVFTLPGMDVVSDVVLGRDYEHWELKNSIRKTGPGLELIFLDERNDTVLSTADHYGAVALLRWSELFAGKLNTLEYLSTATDRSWGYSFPDRGVQFEIGSNSYCLVCNAGADGGAVIVDLEQWKIVHRMRTRFGLEKPIFLPELGKAFSSCPGKHKTRVRSEVVKKYEPHPVLSVFDFDETDIAKTSVRPIRMKANLFQIGVLHRDGRTPLFIMSCGQDAGTRVLIFDPATERLLDDQSAIGAVVQFERN